MIDKLKYATISQIYVKQLKFYSPENKDSSMKLCKDLGITYLPDKDRQSCYELCSEEFIPRNLDQVEKCNPFDLIFSEKTLKKFEFNSSDNVIFVTEKEKILGVVHIVDYNSDFIFFEFYKLFFSFEKMLREFLILKEETNDSFLDYIKQKANKEELDKKKNSNFFRNRIKEYNGETKQQKEKNIKKRLTFGPFQTFYLSDLFAFGISKKYFNISNINAILNLRNKIAHVKDIIKKDKGENLDQPYDIKGLRDFVTEAISFFQEYEQLEESLNELKLK